MMILVSYIGPTGEDGSDLFTFKPILWVIEIFMVMPLTFIADYLNKPYIIPNSIQVHPKPDAPYIKEQKKNNFIRSLTPAQKRSFCLSRAAHIVKKGFLIIFCGGEIFLMFLASANKSEEDRDAWRAAFIT